VPGQKPKKKSERGGSSELSELGGIAGSFLKETLGIGDWLPDLMDLWPIQAADALLNFAIPQVAAFQKGEWKPGGLVGAAMGIPEDQQGWQDGAAGGGGGGTSVSPFGIPDVTAPPAPMGTAASGAGTGPAPGPQTNVTIDQSIHGNVGADPQQVMRERDEGIKRAIPRIPPGN
jgi:hypothetical protein